MPEVPAPPARSIAGWTAAHARRAYFGALPANGAWNHPSGDLVSQRLAALIGRRRGFDPRVYGHEDDLYQAVYADLWARFDQIWQSFVRARAMTWSNLEAYLQSTLDNSLAKTLERRVRKEELGVEHDVADDATSRPAEPVGGLDAKKLLREAFAALSWDEREALLDARKRGRSTQETAQRLGLTPNALYGLRLRGFRRFRNEVVRILGQGAIGSITPSPLLEALVRERCEAGHACFMFKIHCRTARSSRELAERIRDSSEDDVTRGLEALAELIAMALAEHNVPKALDACVWERNRNADPDGDQS